MITAGAGRPELHRILGELAPEGTVISVISLGEIHEGVVGQGDDNGSSRLAALRSFLLAFPVINLSESIMLRFAQIRANLRAEGQLIPDLDLLIGATALHYDLTLVTGNVRHFRRVPELEIYG